MRTSPSAIRPDTSWRRRCLPAAAALLVVLALAGLHLAGAERPYRAILHAWGMAPFAFPFLDTDMVLSGLRCRRLGLDVYVANPCDALGRVYDYAPLWLALARTPLATAPLAPVGLSVDLAFLASLLLLPPARDRRATALLAAGILSTATMFALERGNTDLVIFTLAAAATALVQRSRPLRCAGYALALLAGLLKYYPTVLLLLAVRERPRMLLTVAIGASLALAGCIAWQFAELRQALALIPTGAFFGDMFGARTLPMGLAQLLPRMLTHRTATLLQAALTAAVLIAGAAAGAHDTLAADLARLTEPERCFLMAGASLVLGCFFTAQNIGYRAIDLLPLLPALLALRTTATGHLQRRGAGLALLLLWSQGWRSWLHQAARLVSPPVAHAADLAGWLLREAAWWCLATLLIACLVALARAGLRPGRLSGPVFPRRSPPPPPPVHRHRARWHPALPAGRS